MSAILTSKEQQIVKDFKQHYFSCNIDLTSAGYTGDSGSGAGTGTGTGSGNNDPKSAALSLKSLDCILFVAAIILIMFSKKE